MLTKEDNHLLTRVGPGTPMGELFRRFWLPALLSGEVEKPDGNPVRLRVLSEDLLAFRDSKGKVGIVEAYCSHRGAPLYFGRNEQCGLRCAYHGWKFNVDGECVDVPNAEQGPNAAKVRERLSIKAYPTFEAGGLVWVYMGPKDWQAEPPAFEWMHVPEGYSHVSRWIQRSNWLQGAEGEIDASHISFLHKDHDPAASQLHVTGAHLAVDGAPQISVEETEYGFASAACRRLGDSYFWRVTQWLLPMYSLIPRAPSDSFPGSGGRAWVPIDDYHTTTFAYAYRVDRPLSEDELLLINSGAHFPPKTLRKTVQLSEGHPIDTFVPAANISNDYLIDRALQKSANFSGVAGVSAQDRSVQEGMRPVPGGALGIVDRSREHLMRSDVAIATARRRLLRMARELQGGKGPDAALNGGLYGVRPISKISGVGDFEEFLKEFSAELSQPEAVQ
jgi:phthalate 4,5-dioxygenase oxygenase subunit